MAARAAAAKRAGERGYAMVVALMIGALLIAGGALLAQELMTHARLLRAETNELHLQNVLDSAVSHMMAKYRHQPNFEGEDQLAIDGGRAKMKAERVSSTLRRVDITAHYHGQQRRAVVALFVEDAQPIRLIDYEFVVGGAAARAAP